MKTIILSRQSCSDLKQPCPCARHDALLLILNSAGALNGCQFQTNLAALLTPLSPFELQTSSPEGEALVISFSPGLPDLPAGGVPLLVPDVSEALRQYFLAAFRLLEQLPCHVSDAAAEASIRALALCISRPSAVSRADRSHARQIVEQAQRIICQEYASELTLQAVAGELFVNPCYLSTIFRQITGCTFRSYLKSTRLQHVKRLLVQTNCLITDIAMQTGFNSAAYLISSFRQTFGITPSAYRTQQLKP